MKPTSSPLCDFDGRLIPLREACVPLGDLGFSRGLAAFESLRTYGGKPFRLREHLDRLLRSAELLGFELPLGLPDADARVRAVLAANGFKESLVKIYATAGVSASMVPERPGSFIVIVEPFHPFPEVQYQKGVKLMSTRLARAVPEAKSTGYQAAVTATVAARKLGMDEVVFTDARSRILEGSTFNVGAIVGDTLITPRDGVLAGVTMAEVIGLARGLGLRVARRLIGPRDIASASSLFITSSNREVIPVASLDGKKAGRLGVRCAALKKLCAIYSKAAVSGAE